VCVCVRACACVCVCVYVSKPTTPPSGAARASHSARESESVRVFNNCPSHAPRTPNRPARRPASVGEGTPLRPPPAATGAPGLPRPESPAWPGVADPAPEAAAGRTLPPGSREGRGALGREGGEGG
jgi:hypothetical protein